MNPLQVARHLADLFTENGIAYGIGGSMAMAGAGYVRATEDVDASLFIEPQDLSRVLAVLSGAKAKFEPSSVAATVKERGDFKVYIDEVRVDLFLSFSAEFFDSMKQRLVQFPLEGRAAWFITPEDLGVLKMLFMRPKDLLDLERMVAVAGARYDSGYVRRWLIELMGESDPRIARWDQLVHDVAVSMK